MVLLPTCINIYFTTQVFTLGSKLNSKHVNSFSFVPVDITENESEDTSSHVSSAISHASPSQSPIRKKRKRSGSPTPKYSKLFGKTPNHSRAKSSSNKKAESVEPDLTFNLTDSEIEMSQLIDNIISNPHRREIESVQLMNVTITERDIAKGRRVRIPKLTDFYMDIKLPSLKHGDVNGMAGEADLLEFLFFSIKASKPNWKLNEIWGLGINITLIINGITMIKVDHNENKVVINKLKEFNSILESIAGDSGTKRLILSHQIFPSNPEFFPSQSLDQLVLLSIKDEIPNVNKFLRRFKRLKELCILSTELKKIDLCNDLTCRERLKKLALGNSRFSISLLNPFKNLEELFLWKCDWTTAFEEQVHMLFPNLKKVSVLASKATPLLLKRFLRIKTIEEISCGQFDWGSSSINDNADAIEVKELLISAGLTDTDRSFVLSRSLRDDKPQWNGSKITFESSQELLYVGFQYYHLYASYEIFRS
jgi:hypothetical protein